PALASLFPRRLRSLRHPAGPDRAAARRREDGGGNQDAAVQPAAERGHAHAGGLGRHARGPDRDRRHLRHELQFHAGADLALRLLRRARGDRPHLRAVVLALQEGRLAVGTAATHIKNGTSVETRLFNGSHALGGDLSRLSLRYIAGKLMNGALALSAAL